MIIENIYYELWSDSHSGPFCYDMCRVDILTPRNKVTTTQVYMYMYT